MTARADPTEIALRWDKSAAIARLAAVFAGRVVGADARYISHGEIQTGLSLDGKSWTDGLTGLYAEDFLDLGDTRDLLVACDSDGSVVGMAILAWEESSRRRFAVLEDLAVEPAMRSTGIGERLLAEIEQRVRSNGVDWLFLESGLENHGAHRFFHRHGFATTSYVLAKRLEA